MKSASSLNRGRNHDDWPARPVPVIDCNYQATSYFSLGDGHCASIPNPSFRNISRDYFQKEARHTFVIEAILFAAVVLTSTVALAIGAIAAIDFLRALGYI
jgi:hypothetical protein